MRGWLGSLSPRDRAIYAIMIGMLAIIVAIYLFVGLQSFFQRGGEPIIGTQPTILPGTTQPTSEAPTPAGGPTASAATAQAATAEPPTPTDLPTSVPSPSPTARPTAAPIILPPTDRPTQPPPTDTPAATSIQPTSAAATALPTNTPLPPAATAAQPTNTTVASAPTAASRPTRVPEPTSVPRPPLPPTAAPAPTAPPPAATSIQAVTLYFEDATGSVLLPVRRNTGVVENRVAEAAMRELIAGPRNGLRRLVVADAQLRGVTIDNGLATVNFDRDPAGGDDRGYDSIVLTLTEFGTVGRVQIQVNGANLGGPRARPVVNPANPQNLPFDYSATEFLPLYFPSVDGAHDVRVIRMVPKTKQVGEATVRALLDGPPAEYAGVVRRVIPEGTELRGIKLNNGVLLVDFTQPFADAADLDGAMRTVIESLTSIKTVSGVQFLVEGNAFADGRIFKRPAINQE
jgi:spore germination protein GerM